MAHTILIQVDVSVKTKLKKYIRLGEVIRGEPFYVTYTIRNVGNTKFPGGKVKKMSLSFHTGGVSQSTTREIEIPPLNPGAEDTIEYVFSVPAIGTGWLDMTVEATDGQPIEYYQFEDVKIDGNEWRFPIYSIDRETVQIIDLLQQLLKRG